MFSRTSYKAFKHKAKKGMMKRVGMVESRPEEPSFKVVLDDLEDLKTELKDFHFKVHGAVRAGMNYSISLEHLCGSGIKGEGLFNKENLFFNAMSEHFGPSLDQIITVEIPKLDELIVVYKTAKLDFDSTYFLTVKDMKKKEVSGSDDVEEVIKNHDNLPTLQQEYLDSKKAIINHRETLKVQLENDVTSALSELKESSDAEHHQLYVNYIQKRLTRTIAICEGKEVANIQVGEQQEEKKDVVENAEIPSLINNKEEEVEEERTDVQQVEEHQEEIKDVVGDAEIPSVTDNKEQEEGEDRTDVQQIKEHHEVKELVEEYKGATVQQDVEDSGEVAVEDIPQAPDREAPSVPSEGLSSTAQATTSPPAPTG